MGEKFNDELVLELRAPIKLGNLDEVSVITLTEPNGAQLLASQRKEVPLEALMLLISLNGGVPIPVVERMKQRDLSRADSFFAHFGEPATPPGSTETSSASAT